MSCPWCLAENKIVSLRDFSASGREKLGFQLFTSGANGLTESCQAYPITSFFPFITKEFNWYSTGNFLWVVYDQWNDTKTCPPSFHGKIVTIQKKNWLKLLSRKIQKPMKTVFFPKWWWLTEDMVKMHSLAGIWGVPLISYSGVTLWAMFPWKKCWRLV